MAILTPGLAANVSANRLLDQVAALVAIAVGLDDLRVVGEQGRQGLAVALVVVADERVIDRADRLLVRTADGGTPPVARGLRPGLDAGGSIPSASGKIPSRATTAAGRIARRAVRGAMGAFILSI